ncbi:hypothetical protein V5O48_016689 [Marasmius crinis-equi]|uniref:Uncharacterized protein n=1 Tax=Marasmius crinis-equi TaxID=585013 RepID=A0ABR3ERA7_9AGAR
MPHTKNTGGNRKKKKAIADDNDNDMDQDTEMAPAVQVSSGRSRQKRKQVVVRSNDDDEMEVSPVAEPNNRAKKKMIQCPACHELVPNTARHRLYCRGDTSRLLQNHRNRVSQNIDLSPAGTSSVPLPEIDLPIAGPSGMPQSPDIGPIDPIEPEEPIEPVDIPLSQRHGRRQRLLPAKYNDFVVSDPTAMNKLPLPHLPSPPPPSPPHPPSPLRSPSPSRSPSPLRSPSPRLLSPVPVFPSEPNNADIKNELNEPSRSQDVFGRTSEKRQEAPKSDYAPFPNQTHYRLIKWHCDSERSQSLNHLDNLLDDIFHQPDFELKHLDGFHAHTAAALMDKEISSTKSAGLPFQSYEGSIDDTVDIPLPRARYDIDEDRAPTVTVKNVHHRNLHDVIQAEMQKPHAAQFQLKPYKLYWKPSNGPVQCVYRESYTSDRMLEFEMEIMTKVKSLPEGMIQHEIGIVAIALYSDSTMLTNFSDASMWPAYFTFMNWSKYSRLKPHACAMNHLIYSPSLPATIQEHYQIHFNHMASEVELRFCKVELLQAIWHIIISEPKFYEAYVNGYVKKCANGIIRHLFYHFFCYSANYVEKVMLACIKYLSAHPCALCLVKKEDVVRLGTNRDLKNHVLLAREDSDELRAAITDACELIFKHGYSVGSNRVKELLKPYSALPIQSAFSKVYQTHGLNHYSLFVPDQFHDNTGRISDFLKHNVRILYLRKRNNEVEYLNRGYRDVPTFGDDTLRRFKKEVAKFSRFVGQDYEDALQCAMPCYEGLFPDEIDDLIQDITFTFAMFLSYSSLRQHTDSTLATFRTVTKDLGKALRQYSRAVANIDTRETKREVQSRLKQNTDGEKEAQGKTFPYITIKGHTVGHQVRAVRYWGTADSTNTQAGEREHKRVKKLYSTTNKKQNFEKQVGKQVLREHKLHGTNVMADIDSEVMPPCDPASHHFIAQLDKNPMKFSEMLRQDLPGDPPLKDFRAKFRRHLLAQIQETDPESIPDNELHRVNFVSDRFYRHRKMRVNYTTYDLRRKCDTISFRRRPHMMMLNIDPDASHPYLYARVIGIYHILVMYTPKNSSRRVTKRMEALYVRWLEFNESHKWGWEAKQLPRLSFLDANDPDAFGFVDPSDVIRASHLIPAFHYGTTNQLLPEDSLARLYEEYHEGEYVKEEIDWVYHYVNIFADCDILMWYRGGGIGHASTSQYTRRLEEEATKRDKPLPIYDASGNVVFEDLDSDDYDSDQEVEETSAFDELYQAHMEDYEDSSSDNDDEWPERDSDED